MSNSSQDNESALERVVSKFVVTGPRIIIGTLILLSIAVNFANVIGRYMFDAPITWAEELMIYTMVWMVFVGCVLVTWDGHHLKMDFFSIMAPSPYKEIMNFVAVVSFIVVCIFVIPQTWTVTELMGRLDQKSIVAEIPMVIPHFALLLGWVLMIVVLVVRFKHLIKGDLASEVEDLVASTEQRDATEGGAEKS